MDPNSPSLCQQLIEMGFDAKLSESVSKVTSNLEQAIELIVQSQSNQE